MQIPIKRPIERVPGGMMIIPLLIGAAIHTAYKPAAAHATILVAASVVVSGADAVRHRMVGFAGLRSRRERSGALAYTQTTARGADTEPAAPSGRPEAAKR